MRIRLEKRREPSRVMLVLSPIAAVVATMIVGAIIFQAIGYDGPRAVADIFFTPVLAPYKWPDVAAKAAPLILIALGLTLGNQAKVWNIGAEGQYVLGALGGAGDRSAHQGHARLLDRAADDSRRHGGGGRVGGAGRVAAQSLRRQRNPVEPDAGLRRAASAGLSGHGALEGPERAEFSADRAVHRRPAVAGEPVRPAVPAWALYRLRAGAGVLAGDGALGIRARGAHRRRGAEGGALRRLSRLRRGHGARC